MKKSKQLAQRILTGSVLALLVLAAIFWLPPRGFILLLGLIVGVAAWEWTRLSDVRNPWLKGMIILLFLVLFILCQDCSPVWLIYVSLGWWIIALGLIIFYPRSQCLWQHNLPVLTLIGILVCIPFAMSVLQLRYWSPGYLLLGLFIVWAADTGAYMAGRLWGRHKLAARVSPNKTIEGFIGGVIASLIFALLGCWILQLSSAEWLPMLFLAIVTNIAAVIGDLFESMMKRYAGIKDSGHWLPGHGGLLDRVDSLTCALPVFLLGIYYLRI